MMGPTAGELAWLKREGQKAMPDVATILRRTPVQTPTGGTSGAFVAHHTTSCRLSANPLSSGGEQEAGGQVVATIVYLLTVPPGTDIRPSDQVQVPDDSGSGVRVFEVAAGKTVASWNMSDQYTLMELQH